VSRRKGCHLRYILHVVDGCRASCAYCYSPCPDRVTVYTDCRRALEAEIEHVDARFPLYCGSSGDVFHPEIAPLVDHDALFWITTRARLFIVTRHPEEVIAYVHAVDELNPDSLKIYVTHNALEGDELRGGALRAMQSLHALGIETSLLYKPLVPGVNDGPSTLAAALERTAQCGVHEVCTGFLLAKSPEGHRALGARYALELRDDTYVPDVECRLAAMDSLRTQARAAGMALSMCHGFVDPGMADTPCLCQAERWR